MAARKIKCRDSVQEVIDTAPEGSIVKMSHQQPCLAAVICAMCDSVGADVSKLDFLEPFWFHEYEWSQAREDEFVEWLTNYLRGSKEARAEMLEFTNASLRNCRKAAKEFVWMYGWKIKAP